MPVIRLGTPETSDEGIAIEIYPGTRRVAVRGWYSAGIPGAVFHVRPCYYSFEELAHHLGLILPPAKYPQRPEAPLRPWGGAA